MLLTVITGIAKFSNIAYGIINWYKTSEHQFCNIKGYKTSFPLNLWIYPKEIIQNTEKVMHMQIKMFTAMLFVSVKN